jgi:hypothetical protein
LGKFGAWLGVGGFVLLPGKPGGLIDLRVNGQRGGFFLRRHSAAIRDQAFDGHDHGEGLDLAGNAASGHLGAEVGDFPEAGQDLFAAQVQPALFVHGTLRGKPGLAGQVGILLDELLLNGGTVLEHVGADTGLGFGVGGGVGVETDGFGGATVSHCS